MPLLSSVLASIQRNLPAAAIIAAPRAAPVITIRVAAVTISAVVAGQVARKQRRPCHVAAGGVNTAVIAAGAVQTRRGRAVP